MRTFLDYSPKPILIKRRAYYVGAEIITATHLTTLSSSVDSSRVTDS